MEEREVRIQPGDEPGLSLLEYNEQVLGEALLQLSKDWKEDEEPYLYWISSIYHLPSRKRAILLLLCESPSALYNMKKLDDFTFMTQREKIVLLEAQKNNPHVMYAAFQRTGGSYTCMTKPDYPGRLRLVPGSPFALFYYGKLPSEDLPAIGIVGARNCTEYGRGMAQLYGRKIAQAGFTVISGMALGIDKAAGEAAWEAGGHSVAVLGCGIDICYPQASTELYWNLRMSGCVMSEFPLGVQAIASHFPARNRIIAGLSDKLLVVEARKKSGSLITADMALEQGKDVFAVPGRADDPLSQGCNTLIRQGAGIAVTPEMFLADTKLDKVQIVQKKEKIGNGLAKEEKMLYSNLRLSPVSLEEIMDKTALDEQLILENLLNLQLKGYVRECSRGSYVRVSR